MARIHRQNGGGLDTSMEMERAMKMKVERQRAELVLLGGSPSPSDDIKLSACFRHAFGSFIGRRGAGWGHRSSSSSLAAVGESGGRNVFIITATASLSSSQSPNLNFVFEDDDVNSKLKTF